MARQAGTFQQKGQKGRRGGGGWERQEGQGQRGQGGLGGGGGGASGGARGGEGGPGGAKGARGGQGGQRVGQGEWAKKRGKKKKHFLSTRPAWPGLRPPGPWTRCSEGSGSSWPGGLGVQRHPG